MESQVGPYSTMVGLNYQKLPITVLKVWNLDAGPRWDLLVVERGFGRRPKLFLECTPPCPHTTSGLPSTPYAK